jgi:hypothetical protein
MTVLRSGAGRDTIAALLWVFRETTHHDGLDLR